MISSAYSEWVGEGDKIYPQSFFWNSKKSGQAESLPIFFTKQNLVLYVYWKFQ